MSKLEEFLDQEINPLVPTIYNVALVAADTEYSQAIPSGTRKIGISVQGGKSVDFLRLAFVTGKVAAPTAPYFQIGQDKEFYENGIVLEGVTVYLASSVAAATAQIICWK